MQYTRSGSTANRVIELDFPVTAESLLEKAGHLDNFSLLESSMQVRGMGRRSFAAWDPFIVVRSRGEKLFVRFAGREKEITSNPFEYVRSLLKRFSVHYKHGETPFPGGAIGYFGYEMKNLVERLPQTSAPDTGFPDMYLAFYDWSITIDEADKRAYLSVINFDSARPDRMDEKLEVRRAKIAEILNGETKMQRGDCKGSNCESNFTRGEYIAAVERAKEYIAAGDIYQVNLSQRFSADLNCTAQEFYAKLNKRNPAPYAAFLGFDDKAVVCSSPECFLTKRGAEIETRPIKGTRPRGTTPDEDEVLKKELLASEKDNAELAMIVDLERNDLGRVCEFGSVVVDGGLTLETYPTVHHLVGTVRGNIMPDKDCVDLLLATFPGGSITGAPKIRAMEIIDELEPTCRGAYTGAIGYIGFNGDMDLNIVIRTAFVEDGRVYFQVGGGIVADSEPEAEYQETLDKARAIRDVLNIS